MSDRQWLAFELHDGLLQWVIGAKMQVAALTHELDDARSKCPSESGSSSVEGDDLAQRLKLVLAYLGEAAEEGRNLIQFIEEQADSSVDLAIALESYCALLTQRKRVGNAPAIVFLPPQPTWPRLEPRRAWSILRIAQQAITNAVNHSQAKQLSVRLGWESDDRICLEVIDDGIGFDPLQDYPGHIGLRSMRQRARQCKAELTIESSAGSGCQLRLATCIK